MAKHASHLEKLLVICTPNQSLPALCLRVCMASAVSSAAHRSREEVGPAIEVIGFLVEVVGTPHFSDYVASQMQSGFSCFEGSNDARGDECLQLGIEAIPSLALVRNLFPIIVVYLWTAFCGLVG
ncbi:hypothetical protein CPC08DRAFT_41048 [Agrocybe pediades]|nr:hypothetical protein CPC08DRAFT_41048 [Agrocybe pediades]